MSTAWRFVVGDRLENGGAARAAFRPGLAHPLGSPAPRRCPQAIRQDIFLTFLAIIKQRGAMLARKSMRVRLCARGGHAPLPACPLPAPTWP